MKGKVGYRGIAFFVFATVFMLASISSALAQTVPAPPDTLTIGTVGSHVESSSGFVVPAQAGNVSAIVMSDVRKTQFWQGYYGNITGQIVLDDAMNSTMFAWELANPAGEIYAVNTTNAVQWNNVTCVNFTVRAQDTNTNINLTTLSVRFNMNTTSSPPLENLSKDAFNYTFNQTYSETFRTGTKVTTAADNCPQLTTFIDEAYQQARYKEVLMHDNQSALVFTALLENNLNGYQGDSGDLSDFQMMVAVDGTPGKSGLATYYFYVELS